MISFGATEFHYFFFDPVGKDYKILHLEMVKKSEGHNRQARHAEVLETLNGCVQKVGERHVTFKNPVRLVDFSTYRKSDHEHVRIEEIAAGDYAFDVLNVELPKNVRDTPFQIVVLPGTFLGLTRIGLETILAKQERAAIIVEPPPHPFLNLRHPAI